MPDDRHAFPLHSAHRLTSLPWQAAPTCCPSSSSARTWPSKLRCCSATAACKQGGEGSRVWHMLCVRCWAIVALSQTACLHTAKLLSKCTPCTHATHFSTTPACLQRRQSGLLCCAPLLQLRQPRLAGLCCLLRVVGLQEWRARWDERKLHLSGGPAPRHGSRRLTVSAAQRLVLPLPIPGTLSCTRSTAHLCLQVGKQLGGRQLGAPGRINCSLGIGLLAGCCCPLLG
jgi:hypothetical protein